MWRRLAWWWSDGLERTEYHAMHDVVTIDLLPQQRVDMSFFLRVELCGTCLSALSAL